jgi:hypothetical protein
VKARLASTHLRHSGRSSLLHAGDALIAERAVPCAHGVPCFVELSIWRGMDLKRIVPVSLGEGTVVRFYRQSSQPEGQYEELSAGAE